MLRDIQYLFKLYIQFYSTSSSSPTLRAMPARVRWACVTPTPSVMKGEAARAFPVLRASEFVVSVSKGRQSTVVKSEGSHCIRYSVFVRIL